MPNTFRGKAQVAGSKFLADVILYPIANSLKLSQNWEEDMLKDEQGDDNSVRAHNEKYIGDLGMILVDKSSTSTAANAKAGAAFFAPLANVTISTCDVAAWNAVYQVESGSDISQENTQGGKIAFKLRRWADSTQNTLMTTTPG
jgi:hypothetical protein